MTTPQNYSAHNLQDFIGHEFGPSDPIHIDQAKIDAFAEITGDHQWIHVDIDKATTDGLFGGTIAHGHLTLSLLATASATAGIMPKDATTVINYGMGKVRFLAPVLSGSTVRANFKLIDVQDKGPNRSLMKIEATMYIEGTDKIAVVAEKLALIIT